MTAAADLTALIERVEEVLVDGAGVSRTITDSSDRFLRGGRPGHNDADAAVSAHQNKRLWAEVTRQLARADTQEPSAESAYDITVSVQCTYYSGDPGDARQLRDCHLVAVNDFHRVRKALCWPGNMAATEAGVVTGLAGDALIAAGASWAKVAFVPAAKIIRATALFNAVVHLT
jgi:hypothetical protein